MAEIKNLFELFDIVDKLKVPSYQRAYAWGEEQLNQFLSDMLEMKGKGEYYYGHFIFEETNVTNFEVIDGQQRITTFILFLIVCNFLKKEGFVNYINKFETVDYDQNAFESIKGNLDSTKKEWVIEDFELTAEPTLSIHRILFALNHFRKHFIDKKLKLKLEVTQIDDYVKILTDAHISTHRTNSKAVAVQIFELQNTRGIKLNLLEKVKSKLMKAVYLNAETEKKEDIICDIQNNFAEIYRFEEKAGSSSFIGELTLEDILFCHLRIVDDGTKLSTKDKHLFNNPSKWGKREEVILNYLSVKIGEGKAKEVVDYIIKLVHKFKLSVELVIEKLPKFDLKNCLVGDVLILDKNLSLEFFILLFHIHKDLFFEREDIIRLWEKLLFTRDFHDRYYQMKSRDDFEKLFHEVSEKKEKLEDVLTKYVNNGFRPELMDNRKLSLTVANFIENNKSNILKNAFNWWNGKMVYALYKYERAHGADVNKLRLIIRGGRSVEHILPQEWKWDWIDENDIMKISEEGKKMNDEISSVINGIGNLLLLTGNENTSKSNNHPKDKFYISCSGGSYTIHNENKGQWEDHRNWEKLITERGKNVYEFLKDFIV